MKTFLGFDKVEWSYVKFVFFQNLVVTTFALMFFWNGWEFMVFKHVSLGSVLEFLLIVVSIPLYLEFAWKVYKSVKSEKLKRVYAVFSLVMFILVVCGVGVHFFASQISKVTDTPMIEIYGEGLYYYMIWIGIIGLNIFFAFFQKKIPLKAPLGNPEVVAIGSSGIIQGLVATLGILECRFGFPGLVLSSVAFAILSFEQYGKKIRKYPLYIFYNYCLVTVIILIIVWVLVYGGFFEPSKINFGGF